MILNLSCPFDLTIQCLGAQLTWLTRLRDSTYLRLLLVRELLCTQVYLRSLGTWITITSLYYTGLTADLTFYWACLGPLACFIKSKVIFSWPWRMWLNSFVILYLCQRQILSKLSFLWNLAHVISGPVIVPLKSDLHLNVCSTRQCDVLELFLLQMLYLSYNKLSRSYVLRAIFVNCGCQREDVKQIFLWNPSLST